MTVDDYLPNGTSWPNGTSFAWANGSTLEVANGANGTPMWAELIEKAFAELNAEPNAVHGAYNYLVAAPGNSYAGLGFPQNTLAEITGQNSRPNKFGFPPEYFNADNEPLLGEYEAPVQIMEAPHLNAQSSSTPFEDVIELGTDIAWARASMRSMRK